MATQRKRTKAKKQHGTISRRTFVQSVVAASAAITATALPSAAAPAVSAGVTPSAPGTGAFKVLTSEQGTLLTTVLNRLVPAEGNMPGAGDAGVARFIDDIMVEAPHLRRPILDVLGEVHAASATAPLPDADVDALLHQVERSQKASFDLLLQTTYTGYYTHPEVLKAIGWAPAGSGHVPEPFDVSLLEDVRSRGPIYRNV